MRRDGCRVYVCRRVCSVASRPPPRFSRPRKHTSPRGRPRSRARRLSPRTRCRGYVLRARVAPRPAAATPVALEYTHIFHTRTHTHLDHLKQPHTSTALSIRSTGRTQAHHLSPTHRPVHDHSRRRASMRMPSRRHLAAISPPPHTPRPRVQAAGAISMRAAKSRRTHSERIDCRCAYAPRLHSVAAGCCLSPPMPQLLVALGEGRERSHAGLRRWPGRRCDGMCLTGPVGSREPPAARAGAPRDHQRNPAAALSRPGAPRPVRA